MALTPDRMCSIYFAGSVNKATIELKANAANYIDVLLVLLSLLLFDAARAVCTAGSMYRSGVPPSVRLSVCSVDRQQQRAAGLLLSALRAGDIDRRLRAPAPRTSYRSISPAGARAPLSSKCG